MIKLTITSEVLKEEIENEIKELEKHQTLMMMGRRRLV
jgi:hypothetical protein